MTTRFKELGRQQLAKLKMLEDEMGCCIVALEPEKLASITKSQIRKLQALEKELGTTLLAYSCEQ